MASTHEESSLSSAAAPFDVAAKDEAWPPIGKPLTKQKEAAAADPTAPDGGGSGSRGEPPSDGASDGACEDGSDSGGYRKRSGGDGRWQTRAAAGWLAAAAAGAGAGGSREQWPCSSVHSGHSTGTSKGAGRGGAKWLPKDLVEPGAKFKVPQSAIGMLLGKGGKNLKDIISETGSAVEIDQSTHDRGYSTVRIPRGPGANKAHELIACRLWDAGIDVRGPDHLEQREIKIPQHTVGLLIGKAGQNIQQIKQQSGAMLAFDQNLSTRGFSVLRLIGSVECLDKAQEMVEEKLAELNFQRPPDRTEKPDRAPPGFSPGSARVSVVAKVNDDIEVEEMKLDQSVVGLVIGPSGETCREIEGQSGARMYINQQTKEWGYSTLTISGKGDAVDQAKKLVTEKIEGSSGIKRADDEEVEEMTLDQSVVRLVIGPGGETCREIEGQSGARLSINQQTKERGYSTLTICGKGDAVRQAKKFVREKLKGTSGIKLTDDDEVEEMKLDQSVVRLVIGPGGETCREIEGQSGARLYINQQTKESGYSTLIITGEDDAVRQAKKLVIAKIADATGIKGDSEADLTCRVDQRSIARLIGKQGETLKSIYDQTGAKIEVDQSTKEQGYSVVRIKPGPGALRARELIASMVRESEWQALRIEQRHVGLIIGPSGKTAQQIQEQTGAKVDFDQSTKSQGYSTLWLSGNRRAIELAREIVEDKLSQARNAAAEVGSALGKWSARPHSESTKGVRDCEPPESWDDAFPDPPLRSRPSRAVSTRPLPSSGDGAPAADGPGPRSKTTSVTRKARSDVASGAHAGGADSWDGDDAGQEITTSNLASAEKGDGKQKNRKSMIDVWAEALHAVWAGAPFGAAAASAPIPGDAGSSSGAPRATVPSAAVVAGSEASVVDKAILMLHQKDAENMPALSPQETPEDAMAECAGANSGVDENDDNIEPVADSTKDSKSETMSEELVQVDAQEQDIPRLSHELDPSSTKEGAVEQAAEGHKLVAENDPEAERKLGNVEKECSDADSGDLGQEAKFNHGLDERGATKELLGACVSTPAAPESNDGEESCEDDQEQAILHEDTQEVEERIEDIYIDDAVRDQRAVNQDEDDDKRPGSPVRTPPPANSPFGSTPPRSPEPPQASGADDAAGCGVLIDAAGVAWAPVAVQVNCDGYAMDYNAQGDGSGMQDSGTSGWGWPYSAESWSGHWGWQGDGYGQWWGSSGSRWGSSWHGGYWSGRWGSRRSSGGGKGGGCAGAAVRQSSLSGDGDSDTAAVTRPPLRQSSAVRSPNLEGRRGRSWSPQPQAWGARPWRSHRSHSLRAASIGGSTGGSDLEDRPQQRRRHSADTLPLGGTRKVHEESSEAEADADGHVSQERGRIDGCGSSHRSLLGKQLTGRQFGQMKVKQKWIGWLIGNQGEHIRNICEASCVRINIDQSTSREGFSMLYIFGPPAAIDRAKLIVETKLAEVADGHRAVMSWSMRGQSASPAPAPSRGSLGFGGGTGLGGARVGRALGGRTSAPTKLMRAALTALMGKWYGESPEGKAQSFEVALGLSPLDAGCARLACQMRGEEGQFIGERAIRIEGKDIFLGERSRCYLDAITDKSATWVDEVRPEVRLRWSRMPKKSDESRRGLDVNAVAFTPSAAAAAAAATMAAYAPMHVDLALDLESFPALSREPSSGGSVRDSRSMSSRGSATGSKPPGRGLAGPRPRQRSREPMTVRASSFGMTRFQ